MIRINTKISTCLTNSITYNFAGLPIGKKRVAVKGDLNKYDVVIVGGNLAPILSNHLDNVVQDKASIFLANDNPSYWIAPLRGFYEKGLIQTNKMQMTTAKSLSKFAAFSDGVGVTQFLPNENAVVLKNGRRVEYDQLVIATGLRQDPTLIKGFDQAWLDEDHPFFTCNNHPGWKFGATKPYRWMYNFNGGEAIFYIPPAPYHGQIESYNFLMAKQLWDRQNFHGRFCWDNSRLTIINANNSFCPHFQQGDTFIKSLIEQNGINVEYNLKLLEVNKDNNMAIFENQSGQKIEKPYNNFYSLMPAKTDPILSNAGLADANGLLDVDQYTLQHKRYDNIFGFGDVANVPTTKTFFAGFNQLHVVRHNVARRINGLEPNARYDGYSEALLNVGYKGMTKIAHKYDGENAGNFDTGFMANLKARWFTSRKESLVKILEGKNFGPPYYKYLKKFDGKQSPIKKLDELNPLKKQES